MLLLRRYRCIEYATRDQSRDMILWDCCPAASDRNSNGRRIRPRSVFQSAIPDTSKNGEGSGILVLAGADGEISLRLRQQIGLCRLRWRRSSMFQFTAPAQRIRNGPPIFFRGIGSLILSLAEPSGLPARRGSWSYDFAGIVEQVSSRFLERYSKLAVSVIRSASHRLHSSEHVCCLRRIIIIIIIINFTA
jgi:hypothetical protein